MAPRWIASLFAACLVVASVVPAGAQIGGFLKKKAKEAAQAPVQQQQAQQQADEAAARALEAPDVVPITQESTVRFRKALGVEIKLRGEFKTMLASVKSKDEYEACKSEFAMSSQEQFIAAIANLGENPTAADVQKAMLKATSDTQTQLKKRCGDDPSLAWSDWKRAERLREIEAEASDALAPAGGAGAGEPDAEVVRTPGPSAWMPDAAQSDAHPYARKYAIKKERWIPFCGALADAGVKSEGKYARLKGVGGVSYVYAASEVEVMRANCTAVMAEINQILSSVGTGKRP